MKQLQKLIIQKVDTFPNVLFKTYITAVFTNHKAISHRQTLPEVQTVLYPLKLSCKFTTEG